MTNGKEEGGSQPCSWCGQYAAERYNEATPESMYLEGRSIEGDNICRVCALEEKIKNRRGVCLALSNLD